MNFLRWLVSIVCAASCSIAAGVAAQSISASQNHTCALSGPGELYCWGATVWKIPNGIRYDSAPMPMVDSTLRFSGIATGWLHDCAVTVDGKIRCAGAYESGELGRNPNRRCEFCGRPDTVDTSLRFRQVVAGNTHTCALTVDNRAFCWGDNGTGALGTGRRNDKEDLPAAVAGNHRWLLLVAGDRHTCGITTEQRVLCWGYHALGSNP